MPSFMRELTFCSLWANLTSRPEQRQSQGVTAMLDLAAEVVTAVATGAGGSIGTKGAEAIGRLVAALRARFRGQAEDRGVLEISLEDPDDVAARDQLAAVLRENIHRDAEFGEWLSDLWAEIRPDLQADASNSVNVISGTVHGNVVQARDIHGSIHLGGA
jgi:hypothetical protein